jgi:catechol 2,3-dioxygenase-like lactoylglutathione lyase family enzyme
MLDCGVFCVVCWRDRCFFGEIETLKYRGARARARGNGVRGPGPGIRDPGSGTNGIFGEFGFVMQPPLRVVRLDHVQLAMPAGREDDARAFYSGVLGLIEIPKPPQLAERGGCWFRTNSPEPGEIHLGVEEDFRPAKKAHPAFRVADLEVARFLLTGRNIEVIPDDSLPTLRRFYIHDPFGNRIELIQEGDKL